MIPIPAKGITPPLFPDGIVALATPDLAREICHLKSNSEDQGLKEVMFYMRWSMNAVNEIRRPVVLIVLDRDSALMLEKAGEGMFTRLGLVEFQDEEKLEQYFDGCEQETFIIY